MRLSVLFLIALVQLNSQALGDNELAEKWRKFQVDFGKSYRSPVEARKRLTIFKHNLEDIDFHNSKYEKGLVFYKKGINKFSDWSQDEFMQYVNRGVISTQRRRGKLFIAESSDLPESVDWREKGIVTPVKDQGTCGSCWAFATTGAIEAHYALSNGSLVSLSEQNLIDCSTRYGSYGCAGGWSWQAFTYVRHQGIESESDYPYIDHNGHCKADSSKIVTKIEVYISIKDESDLQNAIANIGPVSVSIHATTEFQQYSSGVLVDDICSKYSLNHVVLAVGYGSENGKDYYIIKNSWGSEWGESGYVRFARNHNNMCGIADLADYPVIKKEV